MLGGKTGRFFFFFFTLASSPDPAHDPLSYPFLCPAPPTAFVSLDFRYGNWAGVGSGSIPGSTVYAKRAATAAVQYIRGGNSFDSSKVAVEAAMTGQLSGRGSSSMSEPYSANSRAWPTWRRASVASSATGVGAGVATVGVGAGTALAPSGVVADERVMAA